MDLMRSSKRSITFSDKVASSCTSFKGLLYWSWYCISGVYNTEFIYPGRRERFESRFKNIVNPFASLNTATTVFPLFSLKLKIFLKKFTTGLKVKSIYVLKFFNGTMVNGQPWHRKKE